MDPSLIGISSQFLLISKEPNPPYIILHVVCEMH